MQGAGHEAILASNLEQLRAALPGADALVVDLTADAEQRIEHVRGCGGPRVPTLAFYSHVETDVRALGQHAGFDLVVPRSRMAREGARLVEGLIRAQR
ncbi:MAG: hypothetical protein M3018_11665 [Actinomycetota bacterium]|nr:hypothetical protein [Actinomycetota bacterium]